MSGKKPVGLKIIGIMKLVSALLLMALGLGIFHLMGSDVGPTLEHFVRRLHLDPENKAINAALANISGMSPREMKAIDAGTFLYATLYIVEGVGLLMAKHWAEYLTIIATASLVPVEIYELTRKVSEVRIGVLLINLVIVGYLIYRLQADRRARAAEPGLKGDVVP